MNIFKSIMKALNEALEYEKENGDAKKNVIYIKDQTKESKNK